MKTVPEVMKALIESQPVHWRLGINMAHELLSSLVVHGDQTVKGMGSMFLTLQAFSKTEGFIAGAFHLTSAIEAYAETSGEAATIQDLITHLRAEQDKIAAGVPGLFHQVFMSLHDATREEAPQVTDVSYFAPAFMRFNSALQERYEATLGT